MIEYKRQEYLRSGVLPFCPGCGNFAVINSFLRAAHELGYKNLNDFVFCSGIGCAAWIPSPWFKADSIHTTHGRSIPVATGVKLVRPHLNVVVFGGDGDLAGIGLSHLIHAARRNLDVTVILINNMIYGMTGGQVSPTTPFKAKTASTPYENFEYPLDTVRVVVATGACYAARWTTAHNNRLKESIKKALTTNGFSFVEVISPCPTSFGRRMGLKTVPEILRWFEERSLFLQEAEKLVEVDLRDKIVLGEFVKRERPSFSENVYKIVRDVKGIEKKG